MASDGSVLPASYGRVLLELKDRVRSAQLYARRQVNTALVKLYWSIGRTMLEQQKSDGWGSGVVEPSQRLAGRVSRNERFLASQPSFYACIRYCMAGA